MPASTEPTSRSEQLAQAGAWLKSERIKRGWTAQHFASLVGITQTQISNYERGRDGISDGRAADIAQALEMNIIDVRRNLGLWLPESVALPTVMTPEDAILADPTLADQRATALEMIAFVRTQGPKPALSDYDPDAPPWRPKVVADSPATRPAT